MNSETTPEHDLRELHAVLQLLVRQMTRLVWSNPRQTQMTVGKGLNLIRRVDFPKQSLVQRALMDLMRELGRPRPDLYRYIMTLEDAARDLGQHLERPPWERG